MSITIWTSYNNIAFKINPGPDFKEDKERLKFIPGRIPIYELDKFKHFEIEKSRLNKLFEVYGNKVLIKPDAQEYINYYKLQTANISKLPKNVITVKSLDGKVLDPYQEDWVGIFDKRKGILGLLDMSAGKTLCSLLRAANLTFNKLLVVCPAQILEDWKTSVENILGLDSVIYTGSIPKKQRAKIDLLSPKVIICNYEMQAELTHLPFDSIIIDEAHNLGDTSTKVYKSCKKIVRKAQKDFDASVQALTATPMENSVDDLWCLIHLVNPELAGDRQTFLNKFQEPTLYINIPNPRAKSDEDPKFYKKAVKFKTKNEPELKEIIACAGMRVKKEVFMGEKKNNIELLMVDMSAKQAQVYKEVREELILLSKDKTFFLNMPLTRLCKALQAAEGAYNIYPGMEESGKLEFINQELNKHVIGGRKAIVWFRYLEGSEILHSWYPNTSVIINGNTSPAKKFLAKIAFQGAKSENERAKFLALKERYNFPFGEKEAQFLIMTYSERSGAGLNFQACDIAYFMSYDLSATSFGQAAGRHYRRDSESDLIQTKLIVSRKTIETIYVRKVLTKLKNNATLLDGQKSEQVMSAREIIKALEDEANGY